ASYYVHAAVIESLSKISPEMDLATLTPLLEIDSHREVVRQAALTAIGRTRDTAALPPLIDWTKKGRHRNCRIAAMKAMANYLIRQEVPVAQQAECVELLTGYLTGDGPHQRRAAAEALGALGRMGEPALPKLTAVAEHDPDQRVRSAAESAIKAIRD